MKTAIELSTQYSLLSTMTGDSVLSTHNSVLYPRSSYQPRCPLRDRWTSERSTKLAPLRVQLSS